LRFVDDELWAAVKERQERTRRKLSQPAGTALSRLRRPRYVFSSLTRCGECGAGFITLARNRLGCFGASAQGTCTNRLTIRRDEVEQRVLKALQENLLRKAERLEARRAKLVESIMEGVPGSQVENELIAIAARREELARQLEAAGQAPPLLHPSMADLYRQKVTSLAQSLEHPDSRPEATETLRGLIDEIVLTPVDGALRIELKGNLAAMLGAAQSLKTDELSLQSGSVAGADELGPPRGSGWLPGTKAERNSPGHDRKGLTASPSALETALVAGAGQATPRRPFDWLRVVPSMVEGRRRGGCGQQEFKSCPATAKTRKG
jgi:hypothetical protein